MNLLDRYIIRLYASNVVSLFIALAGFVVGVDVFLNLKRFVRAAERLAPESASALRLIALTLLGVIDLWGPRLLQLFTYLAGLVLVIAMGFTCAQLVRRRELVAALASGRSLHRLAMPFLAVSMAVLALAALNQEFLLPRVAHLLPRSANEAGHRRLKPVSVPLVQDGAGRLFYASTLDPQAGVMQDVTVWERDEDGRILRRITAPSATWDGEAWALDQPSVSAPGGGETPAVTRVATDLDPTGVLVRLVRGYGESLSWRQISDSLQSKTQIDPDTRRRLDAIRFGRIATISANFLALVIALPFFLVRVPANMASQTIKCMPIVLAALIGGALGAAAPLPGMPTWLGVFVPTLVLLPIAIAAVTSMRT